MFLESRGNYPGISPSIFTADSLVLGGSPSVLDWIKHVQYNGVCEGYDLVIGNPPYVRIKPRTTKDFFLLTRNLYGLFCELSISLTKPKWYLFDDHSSSGDGRTRDTIPSQSCSKSECRGQVPSV